MARARRSGRLLDTVAALAASRPRSWSPRTRRAVAAAVPRSVRRWVGRRLPDARSPAPAAAGDLTPGGPAPKVSVVVATYRTSAAALARLVGSLDAQTLAGDAFETIFVDDGSPDDTFVRLQQIATRRPNVRVFQIGHSGWPSRPRNVGIERARGEYVLFMDHDDSLFPDGLRRAYEYARELDADVVSPKELRTNNTWWAVLDTPHGNIANILPDSRFDQLTPLTPHKLYRRQLLLDNGIRFPERARALWEDWFVNIAAFRHARVVSVLADDPVYLWHASTSNTTRTFSPTRPDYWQRLEDVLVFLAKSFSEPAFHEALVEALAQQLRGRVIDQCVNVLGKPDPALRLTKRMALAHARRLLDAYLSDEIYARLTRRHQILLHLLRGAEPSLAVDFARADSAFAAAVHTTAPQWDHDVLRFDVRVRWEPADPGRPVFASTGSRVRRVVGPELERAIPAELLDYTDAPTSVIVNYALRARAEHLTWPFPVRLQSADFLRLPAGGLGLSGEGVGALDLRTAAAGRPVADTVYDVRVRTRLHGTVRAGGLGYTGGPRPLVHAGRAAIAYANQRKGLSLDLAQRQRTLPIDAAPRRGAAGPISAFSVSLDNVAVFGTAALDVPNVVAVPAGKVPTGHDGAGGWPAASRLAAAGALHARIVSAGGGPRLEGGAHLAAGGYRLCVRRGDQLHPTSRSITVDHAGQVRFD